ncbi:hypothetical protein RJT34_14098 [Clitoria ternatea]|uniref:Xylanase inhibitor C-terminal domain-containing protein n=1 Tax=Clitoria ternatea TaxID=43366 RepID=A0AAN9JSA6_CLITE
MDLALKANKPPKDYENFETYYHVDDPHKVKIPKMRFLFADGLVLEVPHIGVIFAVNSTVVCLPFQVTPPEGGDQVLFENSQQKTLEIVYDVAAGKFGFGYDGCK